MSYSDLDRDRKRELLINCYAFGLACKSLARTTGFDLELLTQELHTTAATAVNVMTNKEVDEIITKIETNRTTTGKPFIVVRKDS